MTCTHVHFSSYTFVYKFIFIITPNIKRGDLYRYLIIFGLKLLTNIYLLKRNTFEYMFYFF